MMTDVDRLEAGREMDNLLAVEVFKLKTRFEKGIPYAWDGDTGEPSLWTPNDYIVLKESEEPDHCIYYPSRQHTYKLVSEYSTDKWASHTILASWPGDYRIKRQNGLYNCELFLPSEQWDSWAETFELAVSRARLKAALAHTSEKER
jgi:hypothetical protein